MKTTFRTELPALPTRAYWRRYVRPTTTAPCSFETYLANTQAMHDRVRARETEMEACAEKIRAMLPATQGQLTFGLDREHKAELVRATLDAMVGNRSGAVTTGELVIAGWIAGHEVYGLRNA